MAQSARLVWYKASPGAPNGLQWEGYYAVGATGHGRKFMGADKIEANAAFKKAYGFNSGSTHNVSPNKHHGNSHRSNHHGPTRHGPTRHGPTRVHHTSGGGRSSGPRLNSGARSGQRRQIHHVDASRGRGIYSGGQYYPSPLDNQMGGRQYGPDQRGIYSGGQYYPSPLDGYGGDGDAGYDGGYDVELGDTGYGDSYDAGPDDSGSDDSGGYGDE